MSPKATNTTNSEYVPPADSGEGSDRESAGEEATTTSKTKADLPTDKKTMKAKSDAPTRSCGIAGMPYDKTEAQKILLLLILNK
jgi:hypothetical protein